MKNKINSCLWFDSEAEEAANFYVSIFENSKILNIARYDKSGSEAAHRPEGSVMVVTFELDGQKFTGLNGGPIFKFSEAISLMVDCKTQEEVDTYWTKLSAGGEESQCGWLKDKYGLSWQIVPTFLVEMFSDKEPQKSERVMKAMLKMQKLDIAELKRAYEGRD